MDIDNDDTILKIYNKQVQVKSSWIFKMLYGDTIHIIDLIHTIQFLSENNIYLHQFIISEFRKLNIVRVTEKFTKKYESLQYFIYIVDRKRYLIFANIRDEILIPVTHNKTHHVTLQNISEHAKKYFTWFCEFEIADEVNELYSEGITNFIFPKLESKKRKEIVKYIDKNLQNDQKIIKIILKIKEDIAMLTNPCALFFQ